MKYIEVVPKMRLAGKGPDGKDSYVGTVDIIRLIARTGKNFNQGLNVIVAKYVFDACCETTGDRKDITVIGYSTEKNTKYKKSYVELEDTWYDLLMKDVETFDFSSVGLIGMVFFEDMKNIRDAKSEKPEDKEIEFQLV